MQTRLNHTEPYMNIEAYAELLVEAFEGDDLNEALDRIEASGSFSAAC